MSAQHEFENFVEEQVLNELLTHFNSISGHLSHILDHKSSIFLEWGLEEVIQLS
jgi:hypothetical protein